MSDALFGMIGLLVGAAVVGVVMTLRRRQETSFAQQLLEQSQQDKSEELAATVEQLKTAFSSLSREALSSNADDFLKLAKTKLESQTEQGQQHLDEKKKLIDARLQEMGTAIGTKLGQLNELIQSVNKQRAEGQGTILGTIEKATQATRSLQETTGHLREALASPQRRGQWGERMAEDVLRLAGFVEGINYEKQKQIVGGTRPDFTFGLPGSRKVHMDVKFPLANYLKMLDAPDGASRDGSAVQFIKDVRLRIKEVTTRDYIDPGSGTVDYVLVFIPNEQVYGFIHERDSTLLDDAMRSKVVLCAPMTLYAILAVIRQSADNFRMEENSREILELLAAFQKQWGMYVGSMDAMGNRLKAATEEFDKLTGVRTRQLVRQLDKIDDLRAARDVQGRNLLDTAEATKRRSDRGDVAPPLVDDEP